MSTIDLKEIKFKELSAAVVALNNSECFKGKEKIATVGVSKIALVEAFLAAVENVPDNEKGEWTGPQVAGDYYNKIVVVEEEVVEEEVVEEEVVEEEVVEEEGREINKEKKIEKDDKEKKETNKNVFGHVNHSMASLIDDLLIQGTTTEIIISKLMSNFNRDKDQAKSRVSSHLKHMKQKSLEEKFSLSFNEETKEYKIIN